MSTKDFIEKDYYKVLGVPKDATEAEIKKAYRKLAREFHPDANKGNAKAEERFKEISEANDILGDPKKRKEYDEARALFGNGGFRPGPGGGGGSFNFDLGDLFGGGAPGGGGRPAGGFGGGLGDVFGGLFNRGGVRHRRGRSPGAARTSSPRSRLSFTEAIEGATVPLRMSSPVTLQGLFRHRRQERHAARVPDLRRHRPGRAGRRRRLLPHRPLPGLQGPRPDRRGPLRRSARAAAAPSRPGPCRSASRPGVSDGQRIRLRGKGAPGERGGPAGDLYVIVHVDAHPVFGRKGDNLTVTVPVTFTEAALGGEVKVPTLGGPPVTLKLPAGTPNGRTMRARGKGAVRKDGTRGDLLVTVEVSVPTDLTGKAVKRWRRIARRPRARTRGRSCSRPRREHERDGRSSTQSVRTDRGDPGLRHLGGGPALRPAPADPAPVRPPRPGLARTARAGRGRRYSARDIELLRTVQQLSQDEGINLAGIKRIIELENQVAALQSAVAELQSAVEGAAAAMQQREAAVHASYRRDLVPYQEVQQTSALVVWRPKRQQSD